jgi:hypothetical protein
MIQSTIDLAELVRRAAARGSGRTEADLQSDLRTLLLYGGLNLHDEQVVKLEEQTGDGTRRRIDIAVGFTVIEVKEDLRAGNVMPKALDQLAGYVQTQTENHGQRYSGVLTDGADWYLYYLRSDGSLDEISTFRVQPSEPDVEALLVWLEGVLATSDGIKPTPHEIERRLGAQSPAFALDFAELSAMYETCKNQSEVKLKRELYAKLLRTALGTQFTNADTLFIEHTYLVVSAEIIAHAVVGFDPADPSLGSASLVTGQAFTSAQIHGVVEADFFDWVLDAPQGSQFVRGLARRLRRFVWDHVEHDVLKLLYESVIGSEERKQLGEYYTPDWLAQVMVESVVNNPLGQRVLDPSCGSGTFVFHAVRRYLDAAEIASLSNGEALDGLTKHVFGLDLHPVAVTLARVTYLLAIGTARLAAQDRGPLSVPVYLGDSLQWDKQTDILTDRGIVIPTSDGAELFASELIFPDRLLTDAGRFDELVSELIKRATTRPKGSPVPTIKSLLSLFAVHPDDVAVVAETFRLLCELFDQNRNHIWGYYVRNLVRPLWMTRDENKVDVLVGNPPWLAYGFMTVDMKANFKAQSKARKLWPTTKTARNPDLSSFFVVRAVELYLRRDGRFAFVMPNAVLSRQQYEGFRGGDYSGTAAAEMTVQFGEPWDLSGVRPDMFPVPSCAVFGRLTPGTRTRLPTDTVTWTGTLPKVASSWSVAEPLLLKDAGESVVALTGSASPYSTRFAAGANIRPRMLLCVEEMSAGPLGAGAGRTRVRSRRSGQEKPPWRNLPTREGIVETQFVRPVHLGSTIVPYRTLDPWLTVIPWDGNKLLDGEQPDMDHYPGLAEWWRGAELVWKATNKQGDKILLSDQVNYRRSLTNQFPLAPQRVVYTKSGTTLAAARITDSRAVIDHKLYWAATASTEEAHYLIAILNSDVLKDRVKPLQSKGLFGARDWDKYVFSVPFEFFDPSNDLHLQLAEAGGRAESLANAASLTAGLDFKRSRAEVRSVLVSDGVAKEIEKLVDAVLPTVAT